MATETTPSADLAKYRPSIDRIRALCEGEEMARALVTPLPGLDWAELRDFRARAYYLPGLPRTIELFTGLMMARQPRVVRPDAAAGLLADVTLSGDPVTTFAGTCARELLTAGRIALLVDYPQSPPGLTAAQAEAQGFRAYIRLYRAESILGARYEQRGGARALVQVRLAEEVEEPDGPYVTKTIKQVRILELVEGRYQVRVMREGRPFGETVTPTQAGAPLPYIPLYSCTDRDLSLTQSRPMLADVAGVNLAHLNNSALMEWGLMWAACPTPVLKGITAPPVDIGGQPTEESERIRLGSSMALLLPAEGDAKFLEFSGAGLGALKEAMEGKRRDMATLGARMLLDDPRAAVAAETARLQRAGETSTLARLASLLSACLSGAVAEMVAWAGIAGEVSVEMTRNFAPSGMSGEQIRETVAAYQQGALSMADIFRLFQAAEVIAPNKTLEEHREEIEQDAGAVAAGDAFA